MDASRSNIRVESAETGEVFLLRREQTIEQLKMELGLLQPISSGDQILLWGPPFKSFDTQYRPDMVLDNKRIFLFNRRIIVDESLRPTFRPRSSQEPPQPEPLSGTVDASHVLEVVKDEALVNKFVEYIQFFRSELHRNRFYENYVQQATLACKSTVARLKVQLDAIHAVSSNMYDVFNAAAKTHATLQDTFGQQQELHRTLLDNFEANLEQLKQIPLHPSFLQAYELYKAQYHAQQQAQQQQQQQQQSQRGGDGSSSALSASWVTHHSDAHSNAATTTSEIAFPPLQTLYDCIPIDRERKFYQHCLENHRQLSQQFTIAQANYSAVKYSVDNLAKLPVDAATVETWAQQLAREEDTYARGLEQLRSNYVMVHEALTQSIPQDAAALERLLAKCAERRHEYEATGLSTSTAATSTAPISASPSQRTWLELDMKTTVQRLQNWQQTLEHHQELVTRALYTLVRQINAVHNDIQGKLRRDIDWMRKLSAPTGQKSEYLVHLQSLAQLPQNYAALVLELHRRQRATRQLQRQLQPAKQWLARRREQEIVRREQFLREAGLHLPPIFLKLFPSLKDKPPSIAWEVLQEESWWTPLTDADAAEEATSDVAGDGDGDGDRTGVDEDSPFRSESDLQQRRDWQQERARFEQMTREKDEAIRQLQAQIEALQQRHQEATQRAETLATQQEQLTATVAQLEAQAAAYRERQETDAAAAAAAAAATTTTVEEPTSPTPPPPASSLDTQLLQTPPSLHPEGPTDRSTDRSTERSDLAVSTQPPPSSSAAAAAAHVWDEVVAYFTRALNERPLMKLREESISLDDVVTRLSRHSVLADEAKVVELAKRLQAFVAQLKATSTSTVPPLSRSGSVSGSVGGIDSLNVSLGEDAALEAAAEALADSAAGTIGTTVGTTTVTNDTATEELISALHRLLCVTSYRLALPVLAIMDFRVGDNVLFLPAKLLDGRQVWMAFNSGCPFHFLDELSLEAFIKRSKNSSAPRTSIIGRLIFLEHHVVAEGTDPRTHRYNLQPGTKFAICHIEPVFKPPSSSSSSSSSSSTAKGSSSSSAAVPSSPLAGTATATATTTATTPRK